MSDLGGERSHMSVRYVVGLRDELDRLRAENDALQLELREQKSRADDLEALYRAADRAVARFISRDEARALVDGGVEYYTEDEEE
jgi:hypothetical protein